MRLDVKAATDIADQFGNTLANGFAAGTRFVSQLPPISPPPAAPESIAPKSSEPPAQLQSAPLIVLTSATTEIGGATSSGLVTLAGPSSPLLTVPAAIDSRALDIRPLDIKPIGTDPIGSNYTPNRPVRSAPSERTPSNADSSLPGLSSVSATSFETGVPLFIALPGVTATDSQQHYVEVRMQDGKPLVPWLRFDPETGLLSGQAPRDFSGKLQIQIIVRKANGDNSVRVMELRFNDSAGATLHDSGKHIPAPNKGSPRSDRPGVDAGKPGLKDQFAHYGAGGRARDASVFLSALSQMAVTSARADRA
jgi:hypothetical protein